MVRCSASAGLGLASAGAIGGMNCAAAALGFAIFRSLSVPQCLVASPVFFDPLYQGWRAIGVSEERLV